jgi:hypothetical protein
MNTSKQLSEAERQAELAKLDLLPSREGAKRTDALLKALLATPPEPFTPKQKPKKRAK